MGNQNVINMIMAVSLILFAIKSYSQISESDTSTWPKPTMYNVKDEGFYNSHEKINSYYKWRENWRLNNLPSIFLLKYDKERLDDFINPMFELEKIDRKQEMKIPWDSLQRISLTNLEQLLVKLSNSNNPCSLLEEMAYNIISIEVDSLNMKVSLSGFKCARVDVLENDEYTNYFIEKKGDTIIINFDDNGNE